VPKTLVVEHKETSDGWQGFIAEPAPDKEHRASADLNALSALRLTRRY